MCVCAYNEERVIEAKIENLLALKEREPGLEILVYVDAATDRTAEILARYRDRIDVHVATERHGKTHGMNLLVAKASAPIVVFTDANVMLAPDALHHLRRYFTDPTVGCVCGNLTYTNPDASVTAASGARYWRLEQTIKQLEQATGRSWAPTAPCSPSAERCTTRRRITSSTTCTCRSGSSAMATASSRPTTSAPTRNR